MSVFINDINYLKKRILVNKNRIFEKNNKKINNNKLFNTICNHKNSKNKINFKPLKKLDINLNFNLYNINKKINKIKRENKNIILNFFYNLKDYEKKIIKFIFIDLENEIKNEINLFNENESESLSDLTINSQLKMNENDIIDIYEVYCDLKDNLNNFFIIQIKIIFEEYINKLVNNLMKNITIFLNKIKIIINLINHPELDNLKKLYEIEENEYDDLNKKLLKLYKTWIKDDYKFKQNFDKNFNKNKKLSLKMIKLGIIKENNLEDLLKNGKIFLKNKNNYNKKIIKKLKNIKLLNNEINKLKSK